MVFSLAASGIPYVEVRVGVLLRRLLPHVSCFANFLSGLGERAPIPAL